MNAWHGGGVSALPRPQIINNPWKQCNLVLGTIDFLKIFYLHTAKSRYLQTDVLMVEYIICQYSSHRHRDLCVPLIHNGFNMPTIKRWCFWTRRSRMSVRIRFHPALWANYTLDRTGSTAFAFNPSKTYQASAGNSKNYLVTITILESGNYKPHLDPNFSTDFLLGDCRPFSWGPTWTVDNVGSRASDASHTSSFDPLFSFGSGYIICFDPRAFESSTTLIIT